MSSGPPISETDTIFARAYAAALKSKFQVDVGNNGLQLLTSPVTLRGMAAGDLVYPQMTNYLIYKFADALQYSEDPSYTSASAGSYIAQLQSYITWVKTNASPSQETITRMSKAREAFTIADDNFWKRRDDASERFNMVKELYPNQTFWQWARSGNYPPIDAAERTRKAAQDELYGAMEGYFGPDATVLVSYLDNIVKARGDTTLPGPSYNQAGLVDDQDLIVKAIEYANSGVEPPRGSIEQSIIPVPLYSIRTYNSTVQAWITVKDHGATRDQVITIDINQGQNTSWSDYGFKQVKGGSNGFWPFFSAQVHVGDKSETRTLETKGRENDISLKIAMIGIQKFDVSPGLWDVPNVKALFPSLIPGAPNVLGDEVAKIESILVGYDVELKVEFGSSLRDDVDKIYEEVKATGGSMSIFGFSVSAGKGSGLKDRVESKFEDVKWDKATGSMSLTPVAGQVYPTILGVVARRF
ncbi:hypothetical protein H0H93_015244 [Arthromyces matolae]|nr:hypothetical protein H0H93_015244 [Arthromyces matolae]